MASSSKSINMPVVFWTTAISMLFLLASYTGAMALDEYVRYQNLERTFKNTPQGQEWKGRVADQKPSLEAIEASTERIIQRYQ